MKLKVRDIVESRGYFYYKGVVIRAFKTFWGNRVTVKPITFFGPRIPSNNAYIRTHNVTTERDSLKLIKRREEPPPKRTRALNGRMVKCLVTKIY